MRSVAGPVCSPGVQLREGRGRLSLLLPGRAQHPTLWLLHTPSPPDPEGRSSPETSPGGPRRVKEPHSHVASHDHLFSGPWFLYLSVTHTGRVNPDPTTDPDGA